MSINKGIIPNNENRIVSFLFLDKYINCNIPMTSPSIDIKIIKIITHNLNLILNKYRIKLRNMLIPIKIKSEINIWFLICLNIFFNFITLF